MVASLTIEVPAQPPVEVRLDADLVTVGRAETNTLALRDMNVSRHHFSVERREPLGYVLQDQGSRNGTLVNGVSVLNKVMQESDRIQIGGSVLTFHANASSRAVPLHSLNKSRPHTASLQSGFGLSPAAGLSPESSAAPPTQAAPLSRTPAPLPVHAHLAPATRPRGDPGANRARWRKLAEVACAINLERDLDRLLEKILDAVLSLVPSKAGFLVLCEGEDLTVKAHHNAPEALDERREDSRMSRQVCREAIAKKRPVLTQDAVSDSNLSSFLTVVKLQLKSILCVPFASGGEVLGVVYLDEPKVDPFEEDGEAVELVGAFGDLAGIAFANARLLNEIASRERLEEELRIAARMQRALLPDHPPPAKGLELAGRTQAARAVGGDIYDFFRRESPQEDLLISIGDVAGKGVGAGMVMASVRALLHAYAEVYSSTFDLLVHLNAVLSPDLDPGVFVSFLLIRYDEATGSLHYTGAGHEHLVLYRPSTGQMEFVRAGGVVLGLIDDLSERIKERDLALQPGDVVCLYTDGATEAHSPEGEEFGLERLAEAMKAGPLDPESIVERCMNAVIQFTGEGNELHDDLTIVALRKT